MPAARDDLAAVRADLDAGRLDAAARAGAVLAARAPGDAEILALMGEIEYRRGKGAEAATWLEKAAAADRRHARAHWLLGNLAHDAGRIDRAITSFRKAIRAAPGLAEAHNDLGTAYQAKGWYGEAEQCYRQALRLRPNDAVALENLATALRAQGKLGEARRAFVDVLKLRVRGGLRRLFGRGGEPAPAAPDAQLASTARALDEARDLFIRQEFASAAKVIERMLESAPGDAELHHMLGNIIAKQGRRADAAQRFERAIALRSSVPNFHVSRGILYVEERDWLRALECFQVALALDPGHGAALANIGLVLQELGHFQEAEETYRLSIESDPDVAALHANHAVTLMSLGQVEAAEAAVDKALALDPRSCPALVTMAQVRQEQNRVAEAAALLERALAIEPESAAVHHVLAKLHHLQIGDTDRGLCEIERSLALNPQNPFARVTHAQMLLLRGRYAEGWDEYEWRKRQPLRARAYVKFPWPEWDGGPLEGRAILVNSEQGLGDEIMFASCLAELRARAARCVVLCDRRLERLFRRSLEGCEIVGGSHIVKDDPFPVPEGIDLQVPAGSLPRVFRRSAADFPAHRGYLRADLAETDRWRERLRALGPGLRVGLSWKGGTPLTGRTRRTLTLDALEPLLALPGVHWVGLQFGDTAGEREAFTARTGIALHHWQEAIDDLDHTAALMSALELRISVCNTQVHLAGALGLETWVLTPVSPDWRYGESGESMAWYPAARMFRQDNPADWAGPLARVRAALQARLAG